MSNIEFNKSELQRLAYALNTYIRMHPEDATAYRDLVDKCKAYASEQDSKELIYLLRKIDNDSQYYVVLLDTSEVDVIFNDSDYKFVNPETKKVILSSDDIIKIDRKIMHGYRIYNIFSLATIDGIKSVRIFKKKKMYEI
jgi:hypothetical protein